MQNCITVFTDGASRGNPGPGGWGAIVISTEGKVWELGGREDHTTNNRMELSAAVAALRFIEERKLAGPVVIHTDSAYVLQGATGWMYAWEKNGWKTKTGDEVSNQDLWKELGAQLFRMKMKREIEWVKVSGHVGLRGNERADVIATSSADKSQALLFIGSLSDYETMLGGSVFEGSSEEKKEKKSRTRSSVAAYSYVSLVAGVVKTHKTWAECEKRVKGKNAKFKKVFSPEEEAALVAEWTREGKKS